MADRPLDEDRLRELIGDAPPANADGDAVHELGGRARSPKAAAALAAAAVAAIEAERGPRRKYSSDERPPDVVIRRRRSSYVVLAIACAGAWFAWSRALHRPPPVPSDPVELVAVLSPAAAAGPALAPEWDAVRGVSDSLSERGRAVRVGALLVEFERAWLRGDSTRRRRPATRSPHCSPVRATAPRWVRCSPAAPPRRACQGLGTRWRRWCAPCRWGLAAGCRRRAWRLLLATWAFLRGRARRSRWRCCLQRPV